MERGYPMAHKQKYTRGTLGHMLDHYDRSKNVPDLLYPEKSSLNYNLAKDDQPLEQLEFVHKRLSEIKVLKRKDVNVMVDWIVTAPKDLLSSDEENFFKQTYLFLLDRYGKDNVISSYVHKDETTPHMHFAFVPVFKTKDNTFKLSAKEVITRNDLRSFHTDLDKRLRHFFGYNVSVLNEATKEGNKTISELKANSLQQQVAKEEERLEQIKSIEITTAPIEEIKEPTKNLLGKETISYQEYLTLFNKYEQLQVELTKAKNIIEVQRHSYNTIKIDLKASNEALNEFKGKEYYKTLEWLKDAADKTWYKWRESTSENQELRLENTNLKNELTIYKSYYEKEHPIETKKEYDFGLDFEL